MVEAFEGNKAETLTMLPTIRAFMAAHDLPDVTIVAHAGMNSPRPTRKQSRTPESRSFLGARIPDVPFVVAQWRREHPSGSGNNRWRHLRTSGGLTSPKPESSRARSGPTS